MEFLSNCFFPEDAIKKIDEENNITSSEQEVRTKNQEETDQPFENHHENNNELKWRVKEEVILKPDDDIRLHYKTSMIIPPNPETEETMYKSEVFFTPKTNDTSEYSTTVFIYPKESDTEEAFIALNEDLVDSVVETPLYIDVPAVKQMDEMEWTWSRRMYAALAQH
ncbi:uncharacterized protein [Antedon mediterranea]|uniref:uncharacterized protein n=1 Tax=Antedon mediterranea TaxID=105859 RepID=UPI003AF48062